MNIERSNNTQVDATIYMTQKNNLNQHEAQEYPNFHEYILNVPTPSEYFS